MEKNEEGLIMTTHTGGDINGY